MPSNSLTQGTQTDQNPTASFPDLVAAMKTVVRFGADEVAGDVVFGAK
jgi:hypothetical protein